MPRVVISDLAPPRELRPAQKTVDTYAAPEKPPKDDDMQRLGDALAGFSKAPGGLFAGVGQQANAEREALIKADAQAIARDASDPTLPERIRAGAVPAYNTPSGRAIIDAAFGKEQGYQFSRGIETALADGSFPLITDKGERTDVAAFLRGRADSHLNEWATKNSVDLRSPHIQTAYTAAVVAMVEKLRDRQTARVAEYNKGAYDKALRDGFEEMAVAATGGMDDALLAQKWNGFTDQAKRLAAQTPGEMDNRWRGFIDDLAKRGDPASLTAAERLLMLNRGKGSDGQPIGALGDRTHDPDVRAIFSRIAQGRERLLDQQTLEAEVAKRFDDFANGRGGRMERDVAYENKYAAFAGGSPTKVLSAAEVNKALFARYSSWSLTALRAQGRDPATSVAAAETHFNREASAYIPAGQPHPEWKATLDNIAKIDPGTADPAAIARVEAGLALYRNLDAKNHGYLTNVLGLGEKTHKFFANLRVYRDTLAQPAAVAAKSAFDATYKPQPPMDPGVEEELRQKADGIDFAGRFRWGGTPANTNEIRREFFGVARAIASNQDVPMDKAIDAATAALKNRYVLINGQALPKTPGLNDGSARAVTERLREIYASAPPEVWSELGVSSDKDLSIRPMENGTYRITHANGMPVALPKLDDKGKVIMGPDGRPAVQFQHMTTKDLENIERQRNDKVMRERLEKQAAEIRSRIMNTPWMDLTPEQRAAREKYTAEDRATSATEAGHAAAAASAAAESMRRSVKQRKDPDRLPDAVERSLSAPTWN